MGFGASKPLRVEGPHGRFIRDSGGALACSITNAPPASHADAPFLFVDLVEAADGARLERKPLGLARDGEDVATTVMFTGRGLASGKQYLFRLVCVKQRCCMKSEATLGASEAFQAVELASVIATGVGRGIAGSKLGGAGSGGDGAESGEVNELKRTVRRLSETNEALLAQLEQLRASATPQARSESGGSAGSGSGARARASSKPRANSAKRR